MTEQKVNKTPRIGLNGLAKYVSATARQRRKILHDAKYPDDGKTTYYADATREIRRYLLDPDRDVESLKDAVARIRAKPATERQQIGKRDNNAQAVRAFAKHCHEIQFDKLTSSKGPQQGMLEVHGVRISVRPEVLLAGVHRKEECGGAVKLYLSKSTPLTDAGAGLAAEMLKRHAEEQRPDCRHHNRHLLVVDVFASRHFTAPLAVVARSHELDATCREIAAMWSDL